MSHERISFSSRILSVENKEARWAPRYFDLLSPPRSGQFQKWVRTQEEHSVQLSVSLERHRSSPSLRRQRSYFGRYYLRRPRRNQILMAHAFRRLQLILVLLALLRFEPGLCSTNCKP
jgi:hypothetical protein